MECDATSNCFTVHSVKCVLLGDGAVGKSAMILTYIESFPKERTPSVYERNDVTIKVDGNQVDLHLWDLSGLPEYEKLRRLCFNQTDVFLLCFSLVHPPTLESVLNSWIKEVRNNCPGVPTILVGTMLDLRDDEDKIEELKKEPLSPITYDQGLAMAEEIGTVKYLECSALTEHGLRAVLEEAARVGLNTKPIKESKET